MLLFFIRLTDRRTAPVNKIDQFSKRLSNRLKFLDILCITMQLVLLTSVEFNDKLSVELQKVGDQVIIEFSQLLRTEFTLNSIRHLDDISPLFFTFIVFRRFQQH